jgi:hypothetical protein
VNPLKISSEQLANRQKGKPILLGKPAVVSNRLAMAAARKPNKGNYIFD